MNATPPSPESQDTSRRPGTWIAGLIVAEVTIALLYGGCLLLLGTTGGHRGARALAVPSMFLAPAFGGLAASYVWRCSKPTIVTTLVDALSITLFALLIAVIIAHEGMICLVILAPLFYCSVLAGALVGRIAFKTDRTRFYLSLLPLLALLVPGEVLTRADREDVITDELLIHAPASKVWPELTSFPQIPSAPRFWLFRMGLPYPMATTSAGDFIGAKRECIFHHGAIFRERVIELEPQRKLTFEIIESPPDPELIGHLTPHRGQFVLQANPDGTTTLTGSTWYTLHVRPRWYFDLWTQHIFRAVHLRVMEDIRRRAESSPPLKSSQ
jgi:hypothetical protein